MSDGQKVLWAPWRGSYLTGPRSTGCIFCAARDTEDPKGHLRLAAHPALIMLNRYPYASVHLMVAPREHTADFNALGPGALQDVMQSVQHATSTLARMYRPDGFNIGINLGSAAGAGIADHMHWHVVPRWNGDTNFMPTLAGTRVMPEHLEQTWERLREEFQQRGA